MSTHKAETQQKSDTSTHSKNDIQSGYLNTHPRVSGRVGNILHSIYYLFDDEDDLTSNERNISWNDGNASGSGSITNDLKENSEN